MHKGRIWEKGPPATLFADPATAELTSFIHAILSVDTAIKRGIG
jgi:ABC-type histidine transport system ATPase subunit